MRLFKYRDGCGVCRWNENPWQRGLLEAPRSGPRGWLNHGRIHSFFWTDDRWGMRHLNDLSGRPLRLRAWVAHAWRRYVMGERFWIRCQWCGHTYDETWFAEDEDWEAIAAVFPVELHFLCLRCFDWWTVKQLNKKVVWVPRDDEHEPWSNDFRPMERCIFHAD